jgi:hypothetical protein
MNKAGQKPHALEATRKSAAPTSVDLATQDDLHRFDDVLKSKKKKKKKKKHAKAQNSHDADSGTDA